MRDPIEPGRELGPTSKFTNRFVGFDKSVLSLIVRPALVTFGQSPHQITHARLVSLYQLTKGVAVIFSDDAPHKFNIGIFHLNRIEKSYASCWLGLGSSLAAMK